MKILLLLLLCVIVTITLSEIIKENNSNIKNYPSSKFYGRNSANFKDQKGNKNEIQANNVDVKDDEQIRMLRDTYTATVVIEDTTTERIDSTPTTTKNQPLPQTENIDTPGYDVTNEKIDSTSTTQVLSQTKNVDPSAGNEKASVAEEEEEERLRYVHIGFSITFAACILFFVICLLCVIGILIAYLLHHN